MKQLIIGSFGALLFLLAGCGGPSGPAAEKMQWFPRPEHFGVQLPYPREIPTFEPDPGALDTKMERTVAFTLTVTAGGRVAEVEIDRPADSLYRSRYVDYLESLRFEPGLKDSVRVAMQLPLLMQVGAPGDSPTLFFPVQRNRAVMETGLYLRALSLNGVEPAAILSFPPYHGAVTIADTALLYPYIILRLELDETGAVTAIDPVFSSAPGINDQLRSAANWATYAPMKINGRAVASTNYLVVSFFPGISYPTCCLEAGRTDSLPILDRARMQLVPDTFGLMNKPIPIAAWTGIQAATHADFLDGRFYAARVSIDTLGKAFLVDSSPYSRDSTDYKKAKGTCQRAIEKIRFYPAVDYQGRPCVYTGLTYLTYESGTNVRIWYDWLTSARTIDSLFQQ